MKIRFAAVLSGLVVAATGSGCAGETSAKVPAAEDLMGTWAQTGSGFEEGKPVTWKDQTLVIDQADGQGFAGFKEYHNQGEDPQKEVFNGAVGFDGEIRIVDEDGIFVGRLVDGKVLGQYVEVKQGESQVLNIELTRK